MFVWLWVSFGWASPCDLQALQRVDEVLAEIHSGAKVDIVAMGLSEACAAPFVAQVRRLVEVPPEMRALVDAELVLRAPDAWNAGCAGGVQAFSDAATLRAVDRSRALWARCGLADTGWFTEAEWSTASLVATPLVAGPLLAESGAPADLTRRFVRALAGIDAGPPLVTKQVGVAPEIDLDDEGLDGLFEALDAQGLLGEDSVIHAALADGDRPAGFSRRVEPSWGPRATRSGGTCAVTIFVAKDGTLRDLRFDDCPKALQGDVRAAIGASALQPRVEAGAAAPGRFQATFAP